MKYKNKTVLIIGILFIAFFLISIPTEDKTTESLQSSSTYVPAGLIAMWPRPLDTIPEGWVLCDGTQSTPNTTDRFIMNTNGFEDPGTLGGGTNHSHSYTDVPIHDHGNTGIDQCIHQHRYLSSVVTREIEIPQIQDYLVVRDYLEETDAADGVHLHTTNITGVTIGNTSEILNLYPPFYKLTFIKKMTATPVIPVGLIVIWNETVEEIPQGWVVCNGTNNTPELNGRFIMGETIQNPGNFGGQLNHTHTYTDISQHSHSTSSDGASHTHQAVNQLFPAEAGMDSFGVTRFGYTTYEDVPHTHSMSAVGQSVCTTEEADHQPPFTSLTFIMNTQLTEGLPAGCITFWDDVATSVPIGWGQCDGSKGTLDLRDKLLKSSSLTEPFGSTGGSLNHTHTYTEVPYHTHVIQTGNLRHRHSLFLIDSYHDIDLAASTGITAIGWTITMEHMLPSSAPHLHDILPTGISSPQTDEVSNLPPYIKLIFIQNIQPIPTEIGWISPEVDSVILFPRTPTVQFDFDYTWTGVGNDIILTFSNSTDYHDAGSVWGLDHVTIPYLDGEVEATLHLLLDSMELVQTTRSFMFINNRQPSVEITQPIGGSTLKGEYEIKWTSTDPDDDPLSYKIEYNRENAGWVEIASGLSHTSYIWDTNVIENSDSVKIRVTATDNYGGIDTSESDTFSVNNKKIPGFNMIVVISMLLIVSLFLIQKRRKLT